MCLASPHRLSRFVPQIFSAKPVGSGAPVVRSGRDIGSVAVTRRSRGVEMIRTIAAIRGTVTAAAWLAGVPILLVMLGAPPVRARPPSATQVQAWLDDPLQPQYVPGTIRAVAWLIWTLLTV